MRESTIYEFWFYPVFRSSSYSLNIFSSKNLRVLKIEEIKTIPYTPTSHPFVERLIGTVRREYLDHTLFWHATDLERKLNSFKAYYNHHRVHTSLGGQPPCEFGQVTTKPKASLDHFAWQHHCRGLFQTPISV